MKKVIFIVAAVVIFMVACSSSDMPYETLGYTQNETNCNFSYNEPELSYLPIEENQEPDIAEVDFYAYVYSCTESVDNEDSPLLPLEADPRHPLAVALADFFADSASAPTSDDFANYFYWSPMPYDSHAIFVDLDGNGTMGVLASVWRYETNAWFRIPHRFEQNVFWIYNDEVREKSGFSLGVTSSGRLFQFDVDGACGVAVYRYTLFDFADGEVVRKYTLGIWEFYVYTGYIYENGNYFQDHNSPIEVVDTSFGLRTAFDSFWGRYDDSITYEEVYEFMTRHGLHGATHHVWEWANQAHEILSMLAAMEY